MNRHGKFYAQLANDLAEDDDYDDDYDDEEYDDYYDDNEGYNGEEGEWFEGDEEEVVKVTPSKAANLPQKQTLGPSLTTVKPDEAPDYTLLVQGIAQLRGLWIDFCGLPVDEAKGINSLRENNYDVSASFAWLREHEPQKKGGRSLTVSNGPYSHPSKKNTEEQTESGGSRPKDGKTSPSPKCLSHKSPKGQQKNGLSFSSTDDCTLVVAGHVDAGKSTILGHMLLLTGKVSHSALLKESGNGNSIQYAWLLDQSEEERRRGVTIDSGAFDFETAHRKVNLLDAPGHMEYVLSMISSATQADAALLVITATCGEFEAGLHYGTKEHLRVLYTLGVCSFIVAVNKMDVVAYDEERFDEVVSALMNLMNDLKIPKECIAGICPISGTDGTNIVSVSGEKTPWYKGLPLIDLIDTCPIENRLINGPLRISIQDVQQNTLYGKVESGKLKKGATILVQPFDVQVTVKNIVKTTGTGAVQWAVAGEQIEILAKDAPVNVYPGSVGCERKEAVQVSTDFEARIYTFDSLSHPLLPGSSMTIVVHGLQVNVKVIRLISKFDDHRSKWSTGMVKCVPAQSQAIVFFRAETKVALDPAQKCRSLGSFILSQDGNVVGGGLVERIITV